MVAQLQTLALKVTWAEVVAGVSRIAQMLKEAEFTPDLIVAPTRGGLTIGTILSHKINVPMMAINLAEYDHHLLVLDFTSNSMHYLQHLENPKVLIVDEICDTGETIKAIKRRLLDVKDNLEIKTATLHQRLPEGLLVADFYTQVIIDTDNNGSPPIWMIYPWEEDASEDYSDSI